VNPFAWAGGTATVFRRELSAYFDSPIAYVVAASFLALTGAIFMNGFFLSGRLEMTAYFDVLPFVLIAFVPAITMRSWAEERSLNTIELLLTLPLSHGQLVVGKFLAAFAFYLLTLAASAPIVLMLMALGSPDLGLIAGGYVGAALLGGLLLAVGLFASSLTTDQIVAFVFGALLGFAFVMSGHERVVEVLDGLARNLRPGSWIRDALSALPHYDTMTSGVILGGSLLYFVLLTIFFLFMNALMVRRSRL